MAKTNEIRSYLGLDLTKFQKGLKKAENKLYRTMRKLDNIGQSMTRTITAPVIAFGAASIKSAADIDKLKKGLEGIMGSSKLATKEFSKLRKLAKNPGLDLKSAVQGSIKLQAIGFEADKARHSLSVLANAVALVGGSGEDLGGVSLAITQIIGKGKVQAEEINQIAERLPQVRKAMQDAFGTADTEVLQKRKMSAEQFVDDIVGELSKLPKAKASISDTLNNLRDDFNVMAAEIGVKLFPIFNKLVGLLLKVFNAFSSLSEAQKDSYIKWGLIAAAAGPVFIALSKVVQVFQVLFKWLSKGAIFNPWVAGIAAIAVGAVLIYKNWDIVKKQIVKIANYFIDLYNDSLAFRIVVEATVLIFKNMWEYVKAIAEGLKSLFTNLWTALTDWKKAKDAFSNLMSDFETIYDNFTENTAENLQDALDNIVLKPKLENIDESDIDKFTKNVGDKLANAATSAKGWVSDLFDTGGGGGGESPSRAQVGTSKLLGVDMSKLDTTIPVNIEINKEGIQESVDFTKNAFTKMALALEKSFDKVVGHISQVFGQISGIVDQFYTNKYAQIEKDYETQKRFIESAVSSESNKAKMMEEIEAVRAKKVSEIRRKEAIANKAQAVFDSIINTAVAVSQVIANPVMAGIVGALGAAQTALIASQPIPALAKGGLAYGPTYAMVGDNKNAGVDPEVIAPLSKLKSIMGNSGGSTRLYGEFGIAGDDLRLVLDTANYNYSRNSGYGRAV